MLPERVSVPVVVLEREPTPDRTEEIAPAWALSAVAMSTVPPRSEPLTRVTLLVTVVVVRSTVPPLIVTAPVPSAALSVTARAPPVTVVPPVKVLAAVSVWIAAPDLTRATEPPSAPPKVVSAEPPRVTVEPAAPVRAPVPARPLAVTDWPLTSTVAPVATVRRLAASPRAPALPRVTVPPLTATSPVKVLAPERVTVPARARPEVPVSAAETVPEVRTSLETSKEPPVSVPPEIVTRFTMLRPPRFREPPVTVTAPAPSAASLPRVTVPSEIEAPPVKVLAPLRVRVPVPDLTKEPSPSIREERVPAVAVRILVVARLMVPPAIVPPFRKTVLPTLEVPRLTTPPLTVREPVPKAVSVPALTLPPSTVTPPPKLLLPLMLTVPEPVLAIPPCPVMADEIVPA